MSKGAQLWPGERMQRFFRKHIRRETELDDEAAERLAEALTRVVNRMLVWDDGAAGDDSTRSGEQETPRFNPFAFSAMVALVKTGRDGLFSRLADIAGVDDLKAFAEAQHLAIDADLEEPDALREAIVAATEKRLAGRHAAAS